MKLIKETDKSYHRRTVEGLVMVLEQKIKDFRLATIDKDIWLEARPELYMVTTHYEVPKNLELYESDHEIYNVLDLGSGLITKT